MHIAAVAYYINTLALTVRALGVAGIGQLFQSWGPFSKNMCLTLCQFSKKKSYPIRPVEGFKLCFDFLCNTDIT